MGQAVGVQDRGVVTMQGQALGQICSLHASVRGTGTRSKGAWGADRGPYRSSWKLFKWPCRPNTCPPLLYLDSSLDPHIWVVPRTCKLLLYSFLDGAFPVQAHSWLASHLTS